MRVLFGLLCLQLSVACWSQSNPPAPSSPPAAHHQKSENQELKSSAASSQSAAASPVPIVQTTTPQTDKPQGKEGSAKPDEHSTAEWWVARATVGLVIVTGLLAWFTYGLYRETVKLAEDAKQSSAQQAKDTIAALAISKESADATKALVESTNANAQMQLRAYVNVFKVSASWHNDETDKLRPITISVETKNSGQTPAHRISGWMTSKSSKTLPDDFSNNDARGVTSIAVQAPGQNSYFGTSRPLVVDADSEIKLWENGYERLYVWGEVSYLDAFGHPRITKFRYVMPREGVGADGGTH